MMTAEQERNQAMDVAKGVAIICVLWVHFVQYYYVDDTVPVFEDYAMKFIHSFVMPLFMIMSGYFFCYTMKKRNLKEIIINRIKNLVWPACVWGACLYFIQYVVEMKVMKVEMEFSLQEMWWSIQGTWFLWTLLICSVFVCIIGKLFDGRLEIIVLVFAFPLLYFIPNYNNHMFMYPYFILGYLYNKYKDTISQKFIKGCKISLAAMFPILLPYYSSNSYIYTTGITNFETISKFMAQLKIDIYRYAIGLCGAVFVIMVVEYCTEYFRNSKVVRKIAGFGAMSLQIYVMQKIAVEYLAVGCWAKIISVLGFNPLTENTVLYDWVFTLLLALIGCEILYQITLLVKKTTMLSKILFGR